MTRKADKLFQLTNLIRARQPITAERIAAEMSMSVRTVYRYIDDLSVSGIPIYGTTGIGYQLHDNFELPPLNLTERELEALLLGVKMVAGWTGEELADSAHSLAKKVAAVVPRSMLDGYNDVIFAPDFMHSESHRKTWETVHHAIKNSDEIKIEYLSLAEEQSSRTVCPLGLVYWGGKWTLASWCKKQQDFRNFRTDRITDIKTTDKQFVKTEKICLNAFMQAVK